MFINIFTLLKCDVAENWQLSLQDSASPGAEGMLFFHNQLMLFLITIGVCVIWFLFLAILKFNKTKTSRAIAFTHSSTLEILWTILPAIILLMISIPSFSLLYSLDEIITPEHTVKIIGHQWYWSYEYEVANPKLALHLSNKETAKELLSASAQLNPSQAQVVAFLESPTLSPSALEVTSVLVAHAKQLKTSQEGWKEFIEGFRDAYSEEFNKPIVYTKEIAFDSYMIKTKELEEGNWNWRLLEVDKTLPLPINTHIRLLITSSDVLHSWAVPSLGIKVDACPGRLSEASVFIKRPGVLYGQCSEICGINHGLMPIRVKCCLSSALGNLSADLD